MSRKFVAGVIGFLACLTATVAISPSADAKTNLQSNVIAECAGVSLSASAAEVKESGSLGGEVTYTLYDNGLLAIAGKGAMETSTADIIQNKSLVTSISFGSDVTFIANGILNDLPALTKLTVPGTIKSIASNAFEGCTELKSVTISDGVSELGVALFQRCLKLESVTLPYAGESAESVSVNNAVPLSYLLFGSANIANTYYAPAGGYASYVPLALKQIIITGGDRIPPSAFANMSSLETITLPDSITEFGASAFQNCAALKTFICSDHVEKIDNLAFSGCKALTNIDFAMFADYIGDMAFEQCASVTNASFYGKDVTIGNSILASCTNLKVLVIGSDAKQIGYTLMNGCTSVESVTLPYAGESAETVSVNNTVPLSHLLFGYANIANTYYAPVGGYASYVPLALKQIIITGGDIIPGYAFAGLKTVEMISLPDSIVDFYEGAFQDCAALKSFTCSDKVNRIDNMAFSGCKALTNINFANSAVYIGDLAFEKCASVKSAKFLGRNAEIGNSVLASCTSLQELVIGKDAKKIGCTLMNGCNSVERVTLPFAGDSSESAECNNTVPLTQLLFGRANVADTYYVTVGEYSSNVPQSLNKITITGGDILPGYAFAGLKTVETISLPDSIVDFYEGAFQDCAALKSFTCSDKVNSIGKKAFSGCKSLRNIDFAMYAQYIGELAFEKCESLKSAIFLGDNLKINESALAYCTSLKELVIGSKADQIGITLMNGCNSVERVTLPFAGDSSESAECNNTVPLTQLLFGKANVANTYFVNIRDYLSNIPTSLKEITIAGGTIIPSYAFAGMSSLKVISIPDTIQSISEYAFANCSGVTKFVMPPSVNTISENAWDKANANLIIYGKNGTAAESFASDQNIQFASPDIVCTQVGLTLSDSLNVVYDLLDVNQVKTDLANVPVLITDAYGIQRTALIQQKDGRYIVTIAVAAKNYADIVTASYIDVTFEHSVAMYFEIAAEFYAEDTELLRLIEATKQYCDAAAYYFNMEGAAPVSVAWDTNDDAALIAAGGSIYNGTALGNTYDGYSLLLKNRVVIRLYTDGDYIDFMECSPTMFAEKRVIDTKGSQNIYAPTVMNYIYTVLNNYANDEKLTTVCKALFKYYQEAVRYTSKQ